MRVFFACLLSATLFAQDRPWQTLSAQDGVPAIQYRLSNNFDTDGLRIEIRAGSQDLSKWALHAWVADPRMVEARDRHLREIRADIEDATGLLKAPKGLDPDFKEEIQAFLPKAMKARQHFRDYDPYERLDFVFGDTPSAGQAHIRLGRSQAKGGAPLTYVVEIPVLRAFDSADTDLPSVVYGLSCSPLSAPAPKAPKATHLFIPVNAWQLQTALPSDMASLWALAKAESQDAILLHGDKGYQPGRLGIVSEGESTDADNHWLLPDTWSPWPPDDEYEVGEGSEQLEITYLVDNPAILAVKEEGSRTWLLDLGPFVHSDGNEGLSTYHGSITKEGAYALFSFSGDSVPGGGNGMCGGGVETDLIWLKWDHQKFEVESFLIESCFDSIESQFDKPDDGPWSWEWDDFRTHDDKHGVHHLLHYDPEHPERGLVDQTSPMPKD